MTTIKILPPLIANQIKAGEVIERPASVVKELVENSIDAGATEITIELEKGGIDLIRISDNGCGMNKDDLPLALTPHATSKIYSVDDLNNIHSLGFRGEALASISSVARTEINSRTKVNNAGWQISASGDEHIEELRPVAHPVGTTITIRDLFFNVPARRKFLRAPETEARKIYDVMAGIALSCAPIAFTIKHNGKKVSDYPHFSTELALEKRIENVLSKEFVHHSLPVSAKSKDMELTGFISEPTFSRSQADQQYFFINNRLVKDKILNHVIKLAYQDLMPHGRIPCFVLYFAITPELVDVNVHPTKHEVRFRESRSVHDFLLSALKRALARSRPGGAQELRNDINLLAENAQTDEQNFPTSAAAAAALASAPNINLKPRDLLAQEDTVASKFKPFPQKPYVDIIPPKYSRQREDHLTPPTENFKLDPKELGPLGIKKNIALVKSLPLGHAIAMLGATYILAENEKGLIVVDAHAAHERINYEKLKSAWSQNNIPTQALLMPYPVNLSKKEIALLEANSDFIKNFGLAIDQLGPENFVVRKAPLLLAKANLHDLLKDILADLSEQEASSTVEVRQNAILSRMACHSSFRAHQRILSLAEADTLLRELEETNHGNQCSHGRPTWMQFTFAEIGKWFARG